MGLGRRGGGLEAVSGERPDVVVVFGREGVESTKSKKQREGDDYYDQPARIL